MAEGNIGVSEVRCLRGGMSRISRRVHVLNCLVCLLLVPERGYYVLTLGLMYVTQGCLDPFDSFLCRPGSRTCSHQGTIIC